MGLVGQFLDSCCYKIYEMAFAKKDFESKVTDRGQLPFIHLVKLLAYDDQVNFSKHLDDVNKSLINISLLRMKPHKLASKEEYFKFLFTDQFAGTEIGMSNVIKKLNTRYGSLPRKLSDYEVYLNMSKLYLKISDELSRDEFYGLTLDDLNLEN